MTWEDLFINFFGADLFSILFFSIIYLWLIGAISLTIRYTFIDKNKEWIDLDSFSKNLGSIIFGFIAFGMSILWSTLISTFITKTVIYFNLINVSADIEWIRVGLFSFFIGGLISSMILLTILSKDKKPYLDFINFKIKYINQLVTIPVILEIIIIILFWVL